MYESFHRLSARISRSKTGAYSLAIPGPSGCAGLQSSLSLVEHGRARVSWRLVEGSVPPFQTQYRVTL